MTRTEIKEKAQNEVLAGVANALLAAVENDFEPHIIEEMREQALRVMKFFGFVSYPGIGALEN